MAKNNFEESQLV